MMRRLQLGVFCGFGLGVIGICAKEASAELSQTQRSSSPHCQTANPHDIDDDTTTDRREWEQHSQTNPSKDVDALTQLGYTQLQGHQVEQAIATFQPVLTLAHHDIEKIEVYLE